MRNIVIFPEMENDNSLIHIFFDIYILYKDHTHMLEFHNYRLL